MPTTLSALKVARLCLALRLKPFSKGFKWVWAKPTTFLGRGFRVAAEVASQMVCNKLHDVDYVQ